jgi:hypothetical protein
MDPMMKRQLQVGIANEHRELVAMLKDATRRLGQTASDASLAEMSEDYANIAGTLTNIMTQLGMAQRAAGAAYGKAHVFEVVTMDEGN